MSMRATARVRVGRSRVEVCRLGFGSAPLGGLLRETSEQDAVAAVAAARAAGLFYFDTAPQYGGGLSEQRLGRALRDVKRDDVVVSTKIGKLVVPADVVQPTIFVGAPAHEIAYDYSYDGVRRSLDASFKRLNLDRVDIVLIHDVNRKYHGDRVHERCEEAIAGACKALAELRGQGVIGAFGPATKDLDIACTMIERADVDCAMVPGRLTLLDHSARAELLPLCARRSVSVLTAAPFDSGILATGAVAGATYDYQPASIEMLGRVRALEKHCAAFGVSLPAAAIQFPRCFPEVASVVTGMRSVAEVQANIAAMSQPIPDDFWRALESERLI